jgi:uncharacterized protein (TIGR03435 family)
MTRFFILWVTAILVVFGALASVHGQEPAFPAFEVASVRLAPGPNNFSQRMSDTRVDIVGYPLRWVLVQALRCKDYQLLGPEWLTEVFVEIHATIPPGDNVKQAPEMLRRLLIERFGLAIHSESREMEAYQLLLASGGLRMREVQAIDEIDKHFPPQLNANGQARLDNTRVTPDGPVRIMAIPRGTRHVTARTMYERTSTNSSTFLINAIRMTMAELVPLLEVNLATPVVDRTGLTGIYQFTIELPRDETTVRELAGRGVRVDPRNPGVSSFTAVESLGLKLERRRTPLEVLVIDKLNRAPTPN